MNQNPHILQSFDEDLDALRSLISEMGGQAEAQVSSAILALQNRDSKLAKKVRKGDQAINAMDTDIEARAIEMIARRAPLADDLRAVIAALKLANILERIGDYAKNIARRVHILNKSDPLPAAALIPAMAAHSRRMLHDVLDAYIAGDAEKAVEVWHADGMVDSFNDSLFRELLTYMAENPRYITPATHLLFVARHLERIGDQATNIAEIVFYTATGEALEDTRSRHPEIDLDDLPDLPDAAENENGENS